MKLLALLLLAQSPKIDPAVLEAARNGDRVHVWVLMERQAALNQDYEALDWETRGETVVDELLTVAAETQREPIGVLQAAGEDYRSWWICSALDAVVGLQVIEALAGLPDVGFILPDEPFSVDPLPGVEEAAIGTVEWNVAKIKADLAWAYGTGTGIVVANIDTGVQWDHPALAAQYRGGQGDHNYNWHDPSRICPTPAPCDNNGHGTHTMGTIVGGDGPGPSTDDIGVAPGAKWIAAKGCESGSCSFAALLSSGQWVLAPMDLQGLNPRPDLRPHIVSNSWGGGSGNTFFQMQVRAWRAAGMFPVFSAANAGPACGTVRSPGDYPESFAVGATNSLDDVASFSSRGPSLLGPMKPEISAPGVNVRSSYPPSGFRSLSGTSMAAPHVAGAVALLWSIAPHLTGKLEETSVALQLSALNRLDPTCGGTDPNNVYGHGRLDVLEAVLRSVPPKPFRRGHDCVSDGRFDLADPIGLLSHLFQGGLSPDCRDACDVDDNGRTDITDPTYMLGRLFMGGPAPSQPHLACGLDPTGDTLPCVRTMCGP